MNTPTKILIALLVVLGLATVTLAVMRFSSPEDTWICGDNSWIKHGNPTVPMPTSGCGSSTTTTPTDNNPQPYADEIVIDSPKANNEVSSPFTITGKARGSWYFEASFPIQLLDNAGNVVTTSHATAQGDWMTTDFVPFTATLNFDAGNANNGILVIKNDNPSGDPARDKEIRIPLQFKQETMQVLVFFTNTERDPGLMDCSVVYGVPRTIQKTQAVARAALEQLFRGTSMQEEDQGFVTNIPARVKIQSLTIENGIAKVDLSKDLEEGMGGSCRVTAVRAQIVTTLKQFPTIQEVIISVDGRTKDILQP